MSLLLFVLVAKVLNRLVAIVVDKGFIEIMKVGKKNINLTHLQFDDDTIIFCPQREESDRNYRKILQCFEVMAGLSNNYVISSIIPLNCSADWTSRMCDILGCSKGRFPMKYLRIPLGANPKRADTWKPIINRIEKKLSAWKMKILSKQEDLC